MFQLSTDFKSEISMVTFLLLWSISFLPLLCLCIDSEQYATQCPGWATAGECDHNPGFMLVHCNKSCNDLPDVQVKLRRFY